MKRQIILLLALSCCVASQKKNQVEDEGRPYEFGFTIDGQQHRRESKDVNGIIMGEFGFITADGIYHVTVYATDENGSFKILSMRNIRISGPLDEPGYEFAKKTPTGQVKTHEELIVTTEPVPETTAATKSPNFNAPYVFTTLPSLNVPACGGCKIPDLGQSQDKEPKLRFQTPGFEDKPKEKLSDRTDKNVSPINIDKSYGGLEDFETKKPSLEQEPPFVHKHETIINDIENNNGGKVPQKPLPEKLQEAPNFEVVPPSSNNQPSSDENPNDFTTFKPPHTAKEHTPMEIPTAYTPLTDVEIFKPDTPAITVSNQQINIPGRESIPIKDPYPNMQDGLPTGITQNDMLDLLYKFNYTSGFHGHHEKGYKNGAKVGAYFVNGRDGISRVVEYVADENGYRPKVKFINLGYDSPDTPKEGTEKTFGLRGYEFTWFPV